MFGSCIALEFGTRVSVAISCIRIGRNMGSCRTGEHSYGIKSQLLNNHRENPICRIAVYLSGTF